MLPVDAIILGTAQVGLAYGVANRGGVMDDEELDQVLAVARQAGIKALDTAVDYGASETRLGLANISDLQVMTKLPGIPGACDDVRSWVAEQVRASIERLGVSRLHALTLHRPEQLLGSRGGELYDSLRLMKSAGLVGKIGISIYDPAQLGAFLCQREFDLVQAPVNVLDRRMREQGWLDRLADAGCEVHARSVFLQGLLLMPAARRPVYFNRWHSLLASWDAWILEVGLSPLHACIRHVLSTPGIARVVIGVDRAAHLSEIVAGAAGPDPLVPGELSCTDPDLINPSRWPPR